MNGAERPMAGRTAVRSARPSDGAGATWLPAPGADYRATSTTSDEEYGSS